MKKFIRDFSPVFERTIESRTQRFPITIAANRTLSNMKLCLCNKQTIIIITTLILAIIQQRTKLPNLIRRKHKIRSHTTAIGCFAVAEWPKALPSFFCVRSHDSPGFEPIHDAHRQDTLVVEDGFGHGSQHPKLQCMGRLSLLHELKCSN